MIFRLKISKTFIVVYYCSKSIRTNIVDYTDRRKIKDLTIASSK